MPESVFRFAEVLRALLSAKTPTHLASDWKTLNVEALGWEAVERTRSRDRPRWERALAEVDTLLRRLMARIRVIAGGSQPADVQIRTFRLAALERLQHATAASLVAQRFGLAGLHTVVADRNAPMPRRYYALVALAERHPRNDWPLFAQYLRPRVHHAFLGVAAEAARFYPGAPVVKHLISLFDLARSDVHLRAFLSPRILASLYALEDIGSLPFFRQLLIVGHTAADAEQCEVTRAIVVVRRLTGRLEPNAKYRDLDVLHVLQKIDAAEATYEARREVLQPVVVI